MNATTRIQLPLTIQRDRDGNLYARSPDIELVRAALVQAGFALNCRNDWERADDGAIAGIFFNAGCYAACVS